LFRRALYKVADANFYVNIGLLLLLLLWYERHLRWVTCIDRKQQYETDSMLLTQHIMLFSPTAVTLRSRPAAMGLCRCIYL